MLEQQWNLQLMGKTMLDIGSSTGGFSDCAIQNGIQKLYAIDVGSDQFDVELAKNPKICLMEKTDFRKIEKEKIQDANFATIDVSFISVTKLLEKMRQLTNLQEVVCLIKPQFECGKEIANQYQGVILNSEVHMKVISTILQAFQEIGFLCDVLTFSPIRGGDGNIEYLAYFKRQEEELTAKGMTKNEIEKVIEEAFKTNQ